MYISHGPSYGIGVNNVATIGLQIIKSNNNY